MTENRKYCVYNRTRESFLSVGVAVADTPAKQLKVLMDESSIRAEGGLWLTPFRGVPATRGLAPVDVIYLDEDNQVIQAVESFPNHAIELTRDQPASVLLLAGQTIFATQTQPGDMLLICIAPEMEERLARLANQSAAASASVEDTDRGKSRPAAVVGSYPDSDQTAELQNAQKRLAEKDSVEAAPIENASWSIRFLRWLSTDRRGSKRHPLPGLVAYYWTGGAPQAFHIADISSNGFYLLTEERWFPGTMILMTLQRSTSDGDDPDDFISVLTRVIRWGSEGVGLSFVPSDTVDPKSGEALSETGADKKALQGFIQRVQATAGSQPISA